jgi:hypothetical protein
MYLVVVVWGEGVRVLAWQGGLVEVVRGEGVRVSVLWG